MKKLVLSLLVLVLAFSLFACGDKFTEVKSEDYESTLSEFVNEDDEYTIAIADGCRFYVKYVDGDQSSEMEFINKGTGSSAEIMFKSTQKDGEEEMVVEMYCTDGKVYTNYNGNKFGVPYSAAAVANFPTASALLGEIGASISPSDAEFLASLGKVEISGKAGADRKLRLTIGTEEIDQTATLSFNKDNGLTAVEAKMTFKGDSEGSIDAKLEAYTGNITFPSFADYKMGD